MVEYIDKKTILPKIPVRNQLSHKYNFGKILNIAGSTKYIGAAILSSVSALKSGAGYVTLASVKEVISAICSYAPEITYKILNSNENGAISDNNYIENLKSYNVISVGCGITTDESVRKFLYYLLKTISKEQNLVIDADAINILSEYNEEISLKNAIITPHTKELARLLHVDTDEINNNREKYARIASEKYDCITVLKGKNTIITDGDKIYINTTGNSALAKAGTGDVLTGIISAFLAQGASKADAAILGVYMHGLAGDLASLDMTQYCVTASDVIEYISNAFAYVLTEE